MAQLNKSRQALQLSDVNKHKPVRWWFP